MRPRIYELQGMQGRHESLVERGDDHPSKTMEVEEVEQAQHPNDLRNTVHRSLPADRDRVVFFCEE